MSSLYAGFHKSDMTPQTGGIPLSGWGSTHLRLAAQVIDPLYCLATALGNSEKAEIVLLNVDLININDACLKIWREAVSEATGLPEGNILISGTHTHSGPDTGSPLETIAKYKEYLKSVLSDAALRAIADMKPAEVYYGKGEVGKKGTRLNFVRHYKMTDIEYKDHPQDGPVYYSGNNFGFQYVLNPDKYIYTGHESEADPEIQLVELRRENANDILFVNFQSHALITSGVASTVMSSDFPGPTRDILEEMIPNTNVVYVQGCCGNINPYTRIREEAILGLNFDPFRENDDCDNDHRAYGKILANYAKEIHDLYLKKAEKNELKYTKKICTATVDHSTDSMLEMCKPLLERFGKEGNTREVIADALALGLNSPYHATSIRHRTTLPESFDVEVNAVSFGDVALVTAPFELYDQIGRTVKAESPFACTLTQCYSCGANAYLPARGTCKDSYEMVNTKFIPGTGEQIGEEQLKLLNEIK